MVKLEGEHRNAGEHFQQKNKSYILLIVPHLSKLAFSEKDTIFCIRYPHMKFEGGT